MPVQVYCFVLHIHCFIVSSKRHGNWIYSLQIRAKPETNLFCIDMFFSSIVFLYYFFNKRGKLGTQCRFLLSVIKYFRQTTSNVDYIGLSIDFPKPYSTYFALRAVLWSIYFSLASFFSLNSPLSLSLSLLRIYLHLLDL